MAENLDRDWSIGEMCDRNGQLRRDIEAIFEIFTRRELVVRTTGPGVRRYMLSPDGLYFHTVLERYYARTTAVDTTAGLRAIGPWPPPAAAGPGHLPLPVEVDCPHLALFTPSMDRLVSELVTSLDRVRSARNLSDDSDLPLGTVEGLLTKLTAGPGLVHITHHDRIRHYQLAATGLYLHTLARQRPPRHAPVTRQVTFSDWHPPVPVDPTAIDLMAVLRLREWLDRNGGEATRYRINQHRVASMEKRADVDRLLAHYQHVYPNTVRTRTTGPRQTVIVRSPQRAVAATAK